MKDVISEQVKLIESNEYYITAGHWNPEPNYCSEGSYEIGIRNKHSGKFTLLQHNWNEESVCLAAYAIKIMLDNGITVNDIVKIFY